MYSKVSEYYIIISSGLQSAITGLTIMFTVLALCASFPRLKIDNLNVGDIHDSID